MGYEIDFLPVGKGEKSGDAITLRFGDLQSDPPRQTVVVVDGGYTEDGTALLRHISKYYKTRTIDLVISTHPDSDHVSGLQQVLDAHPKDFTVRHLWMHVPWAQHHANGLAAAGVFKDGRVTDVSMRADLRKSLDDASALYQAACRKGIPVTEPFEGVTDASGAVTVIGPSREYYESLLPCFRQAPDMKDRYAQLAKVLLGAPLELAKGVAESFDFETLDDSGETSAENNTSVISLVRVDGAHLLLTGDAGIPALTLAANYLDAVELGASCAGFVQVPHHGSKRNVGPTLLDRVVGPRLQAEAKLKTAFVSAAKDSARHPSRRVTNAFRRRGAPVFAPGGQTISHRFDAPERQEWGTITPLPLYTEVAEDDE